MPIFTCTVLFLYQEFMLIVMVSEPGRPLSSLCSCGGRMYGLRTFPPSHESCETSPQGELSYASPSFAPSKILNRDSDLVVRYLCTKIACLKEINTLWCVFKKSIAYSAVKLNKRMPMAHTKFSNWNVAIFSPVFAYAAPQRKFIRLSKDAWQNERFVIVVLKAQLTLWIGN